MDRGERLLQGQPKAQLKQQAITRKDYESTLKTQLGARGGPDLLVIPDTFFPELANAGLLEPWSATSATTRRSRR